MISFKPLFHLLLERGITYGDLSKSANVSTATLTKMGHDGNVTTEIIDRLCSALGCSVSDIMTFTPDRGGRRKHENNHGHKP